MEHKLVITPDLPLQIEDLFERVHLTYPGSFTFYFRPPGSSGCPADVFIKERLHDEERTERREYENNYSLEDYSYAIRIDYLSRGNPIHVSGLHALTVDMDGTALQTVEHLHDGPFARHAYACRMFLSTKGFDFPDDEWIALWEREGGLRETTGMPDEHTYLAMVRRMREMKQFDSLYDYLAPSQELNSVQELKMYSVEMVHHQPQGYQYASKIKLTEGFEDLIVRAKKEDIESALCTQCPQFVLDQLIKFGPEVNPAFRIFEHFGNNIVADIPKKRFDNGVVSYCGFPVTLACKRLGVDERQTVMIGDTETDAISAALSRSSIAPGEWAVESRRGGRLAILCHAANEEKCPVRLVEKLSKQLVDAYVQYPLEIEGMHVVIVEHYDQIHLKKGNDGEKGIQYSFRPQHKQIKPNIRPAEMKRPMRRAPTDGRPLEGSIDPRA